MRSPRLYTHRLILRPWLVQDRARFAEMNADPRVMEFFPSCLDRAQSDALLRRIDAHFAEHGFGWWALQVKGGDPFIGYVGLEVVDFDAPFVPAVAIGWRLAAEHWAEGFAHEAAEAALSYAFDTLGLDQVVAFTVPANENSLRLMARLGMHRDPADDFEHPELPPGHRLRHHVLYRLTREDWLRR
ncbi:GNAT family acetyltransferase [Pseudomonas aeruginosa]|nr:GNAT family acetyltransferase [Pseudomonas aeruginosa]